jgi:hypothetical protein
VVSNSTENVNLHVKESAGTMIMSSNIHVWHLKPKVDVCVIHFSLHLRVVFLLSRSSDNYELVREPNSGVAMSWVLHAVPLNEVIAIVGLDLEKGIESFLILLVVTSSNKIELTCWSVYALKVVRELILVFHFHLLAAQVQKVHLEDNT